MSGDEFRAFRFSLNTIKVMPLRQAKPEDWPFIIAMTQLASTLEGRPLPAADSSAVRSLLPASPEAVIIAMDEQGCPQGAAWCFLHDPPLLTDGARPVPEMALAVAEAHRRQGIGTALVAEVAKNFGRISLNVHILNPAIHLYVRTGFEVAGRGRGVFGVAMVREIAE